MSWVVVPNPGYPKTPRLIEAACHDRTPFLTVACPLCGNSNHLHESQVAALDLHQIIAVRCQSCQRYTDMRVSMVHATFAQMREEGWIA
jgi:ribosomal protein S27E